MNNIKVLRYESLKNNLTKFESKKICAMIKSNAYGHGMKEIISLIADDVDYFGVVSVEEGIKARKLTNKPILVASKVFDFKSCKKYSLEPMVDCEDDLAECKKLGIENNCHLKLNCGMNRFGLKGILNAQMLNAYIEENKINLKSIYTHFSASDSRKSTLKQYQNFQKLRAEITQNTCICFGGSNLIDYPFDFDMLRVGIGLYGYGNKNLLPVMQIKSFVSKVFYAKKGEFIGYGKVFKVRRNSFFAVVPVGYGDGLRRNLSGKFFVKINGKSYESFGNICMDAFFVKVDETVKMGDIVEVMMDAEALAKKIKTISYEILTGFSNFRGKTIIE